MISGTITLYDRSGQPVDTKHYIDRYTRRQITDKWKAMYGKAYENCELGIEPDIYEPTRTPALKTKKVEEKYITGMGKMKPSNKQNRIKQAIVHQHYPGR